MILHALQQQLDEARTQLKRRDAIEAELREQLCCARAEAEAMRAASTRQMQQGRDQEHLAKQQREKLWSQLFEARLAAARAQRKLDKAHGEKRITQTSLNLAEKKVVRLQKTEKHSKTAQRELLQECDSKVQELESRLEESEQSRARVETETCLNSQTQPTRQLDSQLRHPQLKKVPAFERGPAGSGRDPAEPETFLSMLATGVATGAAVGMAYQLGKQFIANTTNAQQTPREAFPMLEAVLLVPAEPVGVKLPMPAQQRPLALPPKSEIWLASEVEPREGAPCRTRLAKPSSQGAP